MLDKSEVFIQKKNENTNVTSTSKIINNSYGTHRSRHNEVRLRVEITTKHIVTVSFECLQTLPLE